MATHLAQQTKLFWRTRLAPVQKQTMKQLCWNRLKLVKFKTIGDRTNSYRIDIGSANIIQYYSV